MSVEQQLYVLLVNFTCVTFIDTEEQARDWSPERVSDFLTSIKLEKYAQNFIDEGIDGPQLMTANREVFNELGVVSAIHSTQIAVLFRRELEGVDRDEPFHDIKALTSTGAGGSKLASYKKKLESVGVDVDMLLYAQQNNYLEDLLKEIGVTKALDRNRFESALKELSLSASAGQDHSPPSYIAYSTPV